MLASPLGTLQGTLRELQHVLVNTEGSLGFIFRLLGKMQAKDRLRLLEAVLVSLDMDIMEASRSALKFHSQLHPESAWPGILTEKVLE